MAGAQVQKPEKFGAHRKRRSERPPAGKIARRTESQRRGMGLRPMKGDESLAEMRFSRTSFDARIGGRVADRVNGKREAFDRAGGLSGRLGGLESPPAGKIACHTKADSNRNRLAVSLRTL
jgi:hypothetical protein